MFQAQAAEYDRKLAEHVAELKTSYLKTKAANREREKLEARHRERFQVCSALSLFLSTDPELLS